MEQIKIPDGYHSDLNLHDTQVAIKTVKDFFQQTLSQKLNLLRVSAPIFVSPSSGLNDNLNGVERPVSFDIKGQDENAEIVHSLAKWKRLKLGAYGIAPGYGLYTDMNAIRSDEDLDNLHSLYVDQWDWEQTITEQDRNLDYLKDVVRKIYNIVKELESQVYADFPHITPILPDKITFIHAEELLQMYPTLSPKDREAKAARKYGAIFIIGIGGKLSNGEPHDGRAPDYDDWISMNSDGYNGLNGDIILWNSILECPFELSSMGIRVDRIALRRQLEICGCPEREMLDFHKALLSGELPLSIGGGIGQSRLCMFLLQKAHIGEVQASIWPEDQITECAKHHIYLL